MPLDEQAARELIRLLVADGDQAGAVAAYQRLAARLGAELGIGPAAETTRLVSALREEPPGAAACLPRRPTGAGNGAGRLVGRDGEVRALLRHWRASRAGSGTAVAISGDGGMGKTRLAREILDAAAADGALTATAAAGGPGAAAPFALWSELLDDLISADRPAAEAAAARRRRLGHAARGHQDRGPGSGDRASPGPDPLLRGDRGTAQLGGARPAARAGP